MDDQVTNMREMKRQSKVDEGVLLPLLVAQWGLRALDSIDHEKWKGWWW